MKNQSSKKQSSRPARANGRRDIGKTGMQHRNKDKLGSNSGPMGKEDKRKDKFGSVHNQDPQGLPSAETGQVREEMTEVRLEHKEHKRHRLGSRG